jgi:uncharacterized Zn-finger protein
MSAPQTVEVSATELDNNGGVFCPSPKAGMAIWNSHPKVYIHIASDGQGQCPYCGTLYRLSGPNLAKNH